MHCSYRRFGHKMKKIMTNVIKNIICLSVIIIPLQIGVNLLRGNITHDSAVVEIIEEEPSPRKTKIVLLDLKNEYCDIWCYLDYKENEIRFLSDTFGVEYVDVINELVNINKESEYDKLNIGKLNKNEKYNSFEEGLIEYLYVYVKKYPNRVDNTKISFQGDKQYIIDLINYFVGIYSNVDYLTAVSIGAAESGHFTAKYMLNANNIYGGMSSNGLIKYKNIEYGVLSYIRLLSRNYYGKGLNTLEEIGRVYCPTYDAHGNKVASSHWLNLVKSVSSRYKNTYSDVTVMQLMND